MKTLKNRKKIKTPHASYTDDRFFKIPSDRDGLTSLTVRFIPSPDRKLDFVNYHGYWFKVGKNIYNERSLLTLDKPDPVDDSLVAVEASKELTPSQKRQICIDRRPREHFLVNVLIIRNDHNPETQGQVFIWDLPSSVLDIIVDYGDDFCCLDKGANFNIRRDNNNSYRKSNFSQPRRICPKVEDEETLNAHINALYERFHPLDEFECESNYKSYEELKDLFDTVTGEKIMSNYKANKRAFLNKNKNKSSDEDTCTFDDAKPPVKDTSGVEMGFQAPKEIKTAPAPEERSVEYSPDIEALPPMDNEPTASEPQHKSMPPPKVTIASDADLVDFFKSN